LKRGLCRVTPGGMGKPCERGWLGFLEAFRTFWVTPQPDLRVLMDKVGH